MKTIKQFLFVLAIFALVGCEQDEDSNTDLDILLAEALSNAAPNNRLEDFVLPASEDYLAIPQDPLNPITKEKVQLGKLLFYETALATNSMHESGTQTYSCGSCHVPVAGFQAGRAQGISDGGVGCGERGEGREKSDLYGGHEIDVQPIKTPSVLNSAYQHLMLWNGQFGATGFNIGTEGEWTAGSPKEKNHLGFEGVEIQAIAGIGVHRLVIDTQFIFSNDYKALFDYAFPEIPETERYTAITAGMSIAAYERTVLANEAPFQKWLKGETNAMSELEKKGAILFFDKARCYQCHNGPALSSMTFFAIGMNDLEGPGIFGEAPSDDTRKGRGGFTKRPADMYKFKTPQLYSLRQSPFYGHGSSFGSIKEVIEYKNQALKENALVPDEQLDGEFVPLGLDRDEVLQLTSFVEHALNDENMMRYMPQALPSGLCFPMNDPQSKIDLGCY